ncbi:zinc-binding alcohol dehydrogenase [Cnuibacter physcomitrellae]|uniref:Zinc-binding alcohol dehydrogenase n=1 Tax=Cnuibacter physcomitrellae TaxID=1619308 RepID=A0A1X9LR77_9MICO|nr:zinc-binding dehydrogenase [Cnuibacter physcomitrellae]ARJ07683.1 zinc-binding alcohol dehydrogenase [Cnuibacter physcomitrellae]GGI42606.1 zinc-binding alcohol dehydrogenase [Cnuibacter physcomitrellae]
MQGRVAAVIGPHEFAVKEYEVPDPAPGALVLDVRRANVCGSDIHQFHYDSPALREAALGHEFVGQVAALGEGVTRDNAGQPIAVGDRVVAVYYVTCRRCAACLRGDFGMCSNSLREWSKNPDEAPHFLGAFGTHYYVNEDQFFYKVPDELEDSVVAGANCGLSQMLFALDKTRLTAGSTLVVQGAGGLGLYAVAVAKERGARVLVIDGVPERLALARDFHADEVIDMGEYTSTDARAARVAELTGEAGADIVLEVTGVAAAFSESLALVRTGGEIVSVGNLNVGEGFEIALSPGLLTRKNVRIQGVLRYDPWYLHKALDFLSRTRRSFPFEALTKEAHAFDDLAGAIRDGESRSVARASIVI